MNLENVKKVDNELYSYIVDEFERQQSNIELIASENFTSLAVMEACGSVLTNKYAEGKPYKRFYNGCENVDKIEELATMYGRDIEDLKKNEELVERVTESFKSEKAINYIIDNAKIKEVAEKKEEKAEKTTTKKSTTKASETKSEKADSKEEKTKKEPAKKTTTKKSTKKSE